MKNLFNSVLKIGVFYSIISCNANSDSLYFKKSDIDKNQLTNKTIEIDTIEAIPQRGLYFVDIITNGALGHFSMQYAVIKNISPTEDLLYKIEKRKDEVERLSKDYVAKIIWAEYKGWGWFYLQKGKIVDSLPRTMSIIDSLKSIPSNKDFYIGESNGSFSFYIDNKRVKSINYGNLISKNMNLDFDSLDYGLYKLYNGILKIISNNGNDLLKQQDGIYFVPKPGFVIASKFDKKEIYNAIDSVAKISYPPISLTFKSVH